MEATGSNFKPFLKLNRNIIFSRGRYIHISKLEDCKRWRIVILCKLGNSCTTENRFARINLLWQCLQQPAGVHDGVWSQWGVLHAEVISPGVDKEFLYLRGIRGKHTGGNCANQ